MSKLVLIWVWCAISTVAADMRLVDAVRQGDHAAVAEALTDLVERTRTLSAELGRRLFAHVGPADQRVWQ